MAFDSGTADVGEDPVRVCAAGPAGVRVKNLGGTRVFLGGPGVTADGYPLEPGTAEEFYGGKAKQSPVVPAPPEDIEPDTLYARTAADTGTARVSWIGIGG
jgi:hypothetical protein